MKIREIFDTNIDVEWQQSGKFELAGFTCGEDYVIQIEKREIHGFEELKNAKTAEVSFFRNDIVAAFTTAKQTLDVPVKIYGTVLNAVSGKIDDYDAFIFTAEAKHSKTSEEYNSKKKIYSAIADKIAKKMTGITYYERETDYSGEYLITKIKLSEETQHVTNFKNPRAEALNSVNLKFATLKVNFQSPMGTFSSILHSCDQ